MKHRARLACGTLLGVVASEAWIEVLEDIAREPLGAELERRTLLGRDVLLKRGALRGHAARRHGLRRLFGLAPPRLNEFRNLSWLRERLFLAPQPLFGGVLLQHGLPRSQWVATQWMPDCVTLRECLAREGDHGEVVVVLAREIARMHALGFVHRDLYPRNILVRENRVAFLDAWRGGARFALRGPSTDLGCLMLHGAEWFTREEQALFFECYFEARSTQARAVRGRDHFAAKVERERARLLERLVRRPKERRGVPLPRTDWRVPT